MKDEYNNLPLDFQHPGGFVEETMSFISETAVCPQPLFSLAAALTLAGLLYGRHVQSEDGQRTNIFCFTAGYTSSGKDHALKSISRILDSCEATNLRLGQVTSDSAIEWALRRQPRLCALIDEAGHFFSGVTDPNAKGSPMRAIKPALLELWSCANARWKGKQRVPKDGKDMPPVEIQNPHLCLYSTSQPQILFESLSREDLRDGWLSRNLFFVSETRPKPEVKPVVPVPNSIRGEVFAWKSEHVGELITVRKSDEAQNIFAAFNDEIYEKMIVADKSGDESNYLYGKALENATRLALILAVSRGKERAVIEARDAEYATGLVDYLIGDLIRIVNENMSESDVEKAKNRILKIVAKGGSLGVNKNFVTRRTQYMRRTVREEYLEDLVDSGELIVRETVKGGVSYFIPELVMK